MSRRAYLAVGAAVAALFVGGYTLAASGGCSPADAVATQTFTFTNEGVATYTIPTVTETVTVTTTVEPPPQPPPPVVDCDLVYFPGENIQTSFVAANASKTICLHGPGVYVGDWDVVVAVSGVTADHTVLKTYPGDEQATLEPPQGQTGDHYALKIHANFFDARDLDFTASYANGCSSVDVWFVGAVHDDELSGSEVRNGLGGSGVLTESASARIKLLRNRVHDNVDLKNCNGTQAHGLYVQGTGHIVAGNVIYGHTEGWGIQAYPSGSGSVFAQNTIVDNALGCFVLAYSSRLTNNICAFNPGGFVSGSGASGCVISTNVRYQSGSNRPSGCAFSGDITGDPLFVNRAGHDLHVLAGSSAIDTADPLFSYSPDADGVTRPAGAGPDIGAYERSP